MIGGTREPTSAITEVAAALRVARARGVAVDRLLAAYRVPLDALDAPEYRIPSRIERALWNKCASHARDGAFGVHVAETAGDPTLGLLDYMLGCSRTLSEAATISTKYARLLNDVFEYRLTTNGDVATFLRSPRFVQKSIQHQDEAWAVFVIKRAERLIGRAVCPRAVWMPHAVSKARDELERVVSAPVVFDAPYAAVLVDRSLLDVPIVSADARLGRVLERHARLVLDTMPPIEMPFREHLRRAYVEAFRAGHLDLQSIAARLRMNARTLQRRLQAEGLSHRELIDEMRREVAIRDLEGSIRSIDDIAFSLGFSTTSAFHRAFKRWTGRTPAETRRAAPMMHAARP